MRVLVRVAVGRHAARLLLCGARGRERVALVVGMRWWRALEVVWVVHGRVGGAVQMGVRVVCVWVRQRWCLCVVACDGVVAVGRCGDG